MKSPKRVLILEDSPVMLVRLKEALAALPDCRVVGHSHSEFEAVGMLEELEPDLVIADMQLHQGSGLGVLRHIRAQAREPRTTVIILTNFSSEDFHDRSMLAGADAFFDKTLEYDRFLDFLAATAEGGDSLSAESPAGQTGALSAVGAELSATLQAA